jgi:hypothetical protein
LLFLVCVAKRCGSEQHKQEKCGSADSKCLHTYYLLRLFQDQFISLGRAALNRASGQPGGLNPQLRGGSNLAVRRQRHPN